MSFANIRCSQGLEAGGSLHCEHLLLNYGIKKGIQWHQEGTSIFQATDSGWSELILHVQTHLFVLIKSHHPFS